MPQLPLTAWHAEQLRLTVFPVPGATTRSAEWWEQVTGESPEEQTANPKKGVIDVSGPFTGGKLLLHLEPERIDWRLAPANPDLETLTSPEHFKLPTCGPFADAMPLFSEILGGHWLARDDLPAAARIAFGAVLIHPEEDRQSGYLRLPDYIPVQVNPSSSDFFSGELPD